MHTAYCPINKNKRTNKNKRIMPYIVKIPTEERMWLTAGVHNCLPQKIAFIPPPPLGNSAGAAKTA